MRPMKLLAAWGIAMVLSGAPFDYSCPARSVHPLYTEGETVFVPELVGTWARRTRTKPGSCVNQMLKLINCPFRTTKEK